MIPYTTEGQARAWASPAVRHSTNNIMIKHGYDHCWIKIQFFKKIYQLPAVQSKEAFFIFGEEVITFHFDKMSFILRNIFHFSINDEIKVF